MNHIRLLALDLDGTLLTSDKHISPENRAAIQLAVQQGIEPVIITGRPLSGVSPEVLSLPGLRYVITSNGAVTTKFTDRYPAEPIPAAANSSFTVNSGHGIQEAGHGLAVRTALIPPETACQLLQIPEKRDLIHSVFIDGLGYCNPSTYHQLIQYFKGTALEAYVSKSRRLTEDMEALIRSSSGVENIWIVGRNKAERDELDAIIQKQWKLHTVLTSDTDIEIGVPKADKGAALTALMELLHISPEQTAAMGDNANDLGMLHAAGTSVAMGNASEEVKQQADVVTDTNDQHGVAKFIHSILS